jgi:hypothetical protein
VQERGRRFHSRYQGRLADLPVSGCAVQLLVLARRFYCGTVPCGRSDRYDEPETPAFLPIPRLRQALRVKMVCRGLVLS